MQTQPERALLVGVDLSRGGNARSDSDPSAEDSLEELKTLAESAGAVVVDSILQHRPALNPATLVGSGKVNELRLRVDADFVDSVIFDRELSPTQLRNLEQRLECKVIDRTQLILDIFAARARTREGQLQVELAQLNYLLPRLTGRGALMSRLGGGIGTRGPGETQLETDRRRIGTRIATLRNEIERVRATRGIQRLQRQAVPLSTISLVGYTNAGKSTLFNRLTGSEVLVDSRMFATLDPTVRQIRLPSGRRVLVSDTVGFIRNLPTTLVDAFRATLEEVTAAALLLHVVDVTSTDAPDQTKHVMKVLGEIGAETTTQILVVNKADKLEGQTRGQDLETLIHRTLGETARQNATEAVMISARTGDGLDELLRKIDLRISLDPVTRQKFRLPVGEGRALHLLHERAAILSKEYSEDACEVVADTPASLRSLLSEFIVE